MPSAPGLASAPRPASARSIPLFPIGACGATVLLATFTRTGPMAAEIGLFALILAVLLALLQSGASLYGARRSDPALMALGRGAATLQLLFVAFAFAALASGYLNNDFS